MDISADCAALEDTMSPWDESHRGRRRRIRFGWQAPRIW